MNGLHASFRLITALLAAMMVIGLSLAPAAESARANSDEEIDQELKAFEDPSILKRRVWIDTEWNRFKDHSSDVMETFGGLWAWGVTSNMDWAVRLKLPLAQHAAGDAAGDSEQYGLGDIKMAAGIAYRFNQSWRASAGMELRTPSATGDLGNDVWQLQEFGTLAWDATRWLTFSPSFEYNQSVAEEHDASRKHFIEIFYPATVLLPDHWSVTARYETRFDFEDNNYLTQSAKFSIAKQLVAPPLGIALSFKKPFNTVPKDFQVNLIISCYF